MHSLPTEGQFQDTGREGHALPTRGKYQDTGRDMHSINRISIKILAERDRVNIKILAERDMHLEYGGTKILATSFLTCSVSHILRHALGTLY